MTIRRTPGPASHGAPASAPPVPLDVAFHVPAEATSVSLVRHVVRATLEGAGIEDELADDVTLATDEACTNVVLHGRRRQGADGSYEVLVHVGPDRCVVSVAEHQDSQDSHDSTIAGVPRARTLSPTQPTMADAAAEHGRGIALMGLMMDGVRFETDAAGSFHLLLEKDLRPATDAAAPTGGGTLPPPPTSPLARRRPQRRTR